VQGRVDTLPQFSVKYVVHLLSQEEKDSLAPGVYPSGFRFGNSGQRASLPIEKNLKYLYFFLYYRVDNRISVS
jgi:hypothetical protein